MVVADEVYRRFPELPEGKLAKLRAGVVNANALADIARQVNLGDAMLLGKGERTTGGADKQSILADALEAVIGAVHLDAGLEVATSMIVRLFGPMIEETALQGPGGRDHKTRLQELAVAFSDVPPAYRIAAEGPDHARMFNADVIVAHEVLGSGTGSSKKEAEQQAAGQAVEALQARISAGDSAVEPATGSHASTAESPAEDSSTDLSNPKSGAETAAQAVVDAQTESTTERRAS